MVRSTSSSSGRTTTPRSSKVGKKRGPQTFEEDELLAKYFKKEGVGRWRTQPKRAGPLMFCKSCRVRWMNYLRPSVKRGRIGPDEEDLILRLHRLLGDRWSLIAGRIPGSTDNEIKNYWNTHLSKKLISQGIDPRTHKPLNPNPQTIEDIPPSSDNPLAVNPGASSSRPAKRQSRPTGASSSSAAAAASAQIPPALEAYLQQITSTLADLTSTVAELHQKVDRLSKRLNRDSFEDDSSPQF